MEWWQIVITAGSVCGAVGAVAAFLAKWGKKAAKQVVKHGAGEDMKQLTEAVHALQELAARNTQRLANIQTELDANTRLTLKLELKSLFRNHPECVQVIELTMNKYKSLGGDSYIDTLYDEWKEAYEKPKMRKALNVEETPKKKTTRKK